MNFATAAEERAYHLGRSHRVAPAPKPAFKRNAKGQPEYGSVIITMDHLMENDTGHINTKLVLSTEDVEAALRSLWDYNGEAERLSALKSTLDILVEHRMEPNGIFLYVAPSDMPDRFGNLKLEVVMSTDLFAALSAHPNFGDGSELLLTEALKKTFASVMSKVQQERDGFPPLTYIGMEGQLVVAQPDNAPKVSEEA